MSYTNSSLVSCTILSPNHYSGRDHEIDTITIHCVVGQCAVESLGNLFSKPERSASSNYGIGYDGRVGLYVEEKDASWCSSSYSNDNRAITIEVASDNYYPYAVTEAAYNSLIQLCADICKRNGIKELKWKADKNLIGQIDKQNMTAHRWFDAKKSCPGDYLYERFGNIAEKVNNILNPKEEDLPMTAAEKKSFEELQNKVEELSKTVAAYEKYDVYTNAATRWAYIDKNLPKWATPTVKKLVNRGILKGDGTNSLALNYIMLRILVILDRAGIFGE